MTATHTPGPRRKFKSPQLQATYDHYRDGQPDPAKTRGQGSAGNAYAVGLTSERNKPFSVRGSIAYAAWAAGRDVRAAIAKAEGQS